MAFEGFTQDALDFLGDLALHNDRDWFARNKAHYERVLLGPQKELVAELARRFADFDPRVRCEPRVDGSIFRIHRDIRFSRDKSPYKTWADIALWIGHERKSTPGYFIRIVSDALWVGGGEYHPRPEQLAAMRRAIEAPASGEALVSVLGSLTAANWDVEGERRARVPAGFDPTSPRADLLKHTSLHAVWLESPPPPEFFSPELPDWMMQRFAESRPLVDWLADVLGGV